MVELADNEMYQVAGFNGDEFFTGVGIAGGGILAIVALPEVAFVGAVYGATLLGAAAVGSAAGWFMGEGLAS